MTPPGESNTPWELTAELADRTKEIVRALLATGVIPKEGIPGWVAGAVVTALVQELSDGE